jgi:hypothetical protein
MQHFSPKVSTTTRIAEILATLGSMLLAHVIYPKGDTSP